MVDSTQVHDEETPAGGSDIHEVERWRLFMQAFMCLFYAVGIIGSLVVYGLLQERVMTIGYGPSRVMFDYSVFLIFCNRIASVTYALVLATWFKESFWNKAPLWKYLIVSLSNVYASTCQYEALKYVSFAVQMLGKSFKMMPVMIWGMIISRKSYSITDWLIAAAVTFGVTEFLMTGPTAAPTDDGNNWKGFAFLLAFLALDGLTSTMQEKLFKEHKTSKYNQMMYVNAFSAIVSFITMLCTSTLVPALSFCGNYPALVLDAAYLSATSVASQYFIYSQVKEFGALVFAATMNVRQVVSIIVSYVTYSHHITGLQVLGLFVVFAALFYKSSVGLLAPAPSKEEQAPLVQREQPQETTASRDPAKIA